MEVLGLRLGLPIKELEVIDGDTLKVTVTLEEYIRLSGIDAPELHHSDQRAAAEVVGLAVKKWISWQETVAINPLRYDKYGQRLDCVVLGTDSHEGVYSLASWLIQEKLVHAYDGGAKQPWTFGELVRIAARREEFT
jgi:endonuclease YncB( thermonuclease family)